MCDDTVHQYIINNICIYGIDKSRYAVCIPQEAIYLTREVKVWGVCEGSVVFRDIRVVTLLAGTLTEKFCIQLLGRLGKVLGGGPSFLGVIFGSFD